MTQNPILRFLGSFLAVFLLLSALSRGTVVELLPGVNDRAQLPEEVDKWTLDLGFRIPPTPANLVLFESGDDGTGVIVALIAGEVVVYLDQGDRSASSPDGDLFLKVAVHVFESQTVSIRVSADLSGAQPGSDTLLLEVGNGSTVMFSGPTPLSVDLTSCLGSGDFGLGAAVGAFPGLEESVESAELDFEQFNSRSYQPGGAETVKGFLRGVISTGPNLPREGLLPHPGSWRFLAVYPRPGEPMATVVVSGDVRNGTGRLTVTRDISFTAQTAVLMKGIIFQNWTPGDGSSDRQDLDPPNIYYRVNDGPLQSAGVQFADNPGTRWGVISANDGYIRFPDDIQVNRGDRFTFYAGTWKIAPSDTFTAPPYGFLTTPSFISDARGTVLSPLDPMTIEILPEPWTWVPSGNSLSRFRVEKQGSAMVLTWTPEIVDPVLEVSSDLIRWETVNEPVFGNFYVVPTNRQSAFYRLRYE